jgi:branched-chain amino acid transport system ATP-binding protein
MNALPALSLRGVHKRFGPTSVIRGLDLAVAPGERLAIIGPNGAGKSTLFHLISGRLQPSEGSIWLGDRRIDGRPPHQIYRLGLARSFQITNIFPKLSVFDNLRCAVLWHLGYRYNFWRWLNNLRDVREHTEAVLERLQLTHRRDALAMHLTYAEQRALELGITIAGGADVVLLDEPTAGMSQSETRQVVNLIRQVTEDKTLLVVEHDMNVVFELADRIAVLVYGELVALGTPADIRADARVREAYLGLAAPGLE